MGSPVRVGAKLWLCDLVSAQSRTLSIPLTEGRKTKRITGGTEKTREHGRILEGGIGMAERKFEGWFSGDARRHTESCADVCNSSWSSALDLDRCRIESLCLRVLFCD